jgi:hypothetical protein
MRSSPASRTVRVRTSEHNSDGTIALVSGQRREELVERHGDGWTLHGGPKPECTSCEND